MSTLQDLIDSANAVTAAKAASAVALDALNATGAPIDAALVSERATLDAASDAFNAAYGVVAANLGVPALLQALTEAEAGVFTAIDAFQTTLASLDY